MPGSPLILPSLAGQRVRLREWRDSDIAVVQEASRDELIPLVTTVPRTAGQPDRAVGQIGLFFAGGARASVGYWIAPSA